MNQKKSKETKKIFHANKEECLKMVERGKQLSKTKPLPKVAYCFMTLNRLDEMKVAISRVYDYVDKIVAVDGGSMDGTIKYLSSLAKVYMVRRKWDDKFDVQRNQYLNHILKSYPNYWCLVSDTDEWFSADLMKTLKFVLLAGEEAGINRLGFLSWHRIVKGMDSPANYDKKPILTKSNYKSVFYKKLCFKSQAGMRYKNSPHEALLGDWRILCLGNEDWHFEHVKTRKVELERGCRNYFIAGPNMNKNVEWQKFKVVCSKYGWKLWSDMHVALLKGNVGDDILKWIWSRKDWVADGPASSEQRAFWEIYYDYYHKERAEADKKRLLPKK